MSTRRYYAHTKKGRPPDEWEPLHEHLHEVARLAEEFGRWLGCPDEAQTAGLLHDIGKYGDLFQRRLRGLERGIDHWSPGAWVALQRYQQSGVASALAIQGHHMGMQQAAKDALALLYPATHAERHPEGPRLSSSDTQQLLSLLTADGIALPERLDGTPASLADPAAAYMLDVRMLFSALVDADFLATEAHFAATAPGGKSYREPGPALDADAALNVLTRHVQGVAEGSDAADEVRRLRGYLLEACLAAADGLPGLFTLTAPTGSGKTLAMLAFALAHARKHKLRRVVCVLPYLTIIEQTVRVYREALAGLYPADAADRYVLEHHSLAHVTDGDDDSPNQARLLAENWDAPIIVTTTVQCLESLMSSTPSRCRKLHRLANSVILFDEVQSLPQRLAVPTLATLSHLSARYGSTVLFATATQPAFTHLDEGVRCLAASGWQPRELVPDRQRLFRRAARTRVHWPGTGAALSWPDLAQELADRPQVLCIVNLKRHAIELTEQLAARGARGLLHLSTNMCPAHRALTLADAGRRLKSGSPCRLVATQCVEAGVDVDFPEVFRALGPLDAVAQAAGRCNRRGLRPEGPVHVFVPDEAGRLYPDGGYGQAASVTLSLLRELGPDGLDINDPLVFDRYYRDLYDIANVAQAETGVTKAMKVRHFECVDHAYRIIEQDAVNVLVPWDPDAFAALDREVQAEGIRRAWVARARAHAIGLFRPKPHDPVASLLDPVPLGGGREMATDWSIYRGDPSDYNDLLGLVLPAQQQCVIG